MGRSHKASQLLPLMVCLSATSHKINLPDGLIDNLVRSWTFAALEQILKETATSSLPFTRHLKDAVSSSSGKSLPFGGKSKEQKSRLSEPKSMIHPSRSSSLGNTRPSTEPLYAQSTTTGQVVFENGQYNDRPVPNQEGALSQTKNGLQELSGTRAQLVVVQRRVLEQVGKRLDWSIGWATVLPSLTRYEELSEIDLTADDESSQTAADVKESEANELGTPTTGVFSRALLSAVSSLDQFRQSYEVKQSCKLSVQDRLTLPRP
jgi:hypothetical protein